MHLEPEYDAQDGHEEVLATDEQLIDMDDEDAFYWSIAYELVEQLLSVFPSMDPERLLELLKEVDLDVHRAQVIMPLTSITMI
jgi:hypothetical protein